MQPNAKPPPPATPVVNEPAPTAPTTPAAAPPSGGSTALTASTATATTSGTSTPAPSADVPAAVVTKVAAEAPTAKMSDIEIPQGGLFALGAERLLSHHADISIVQSSDVIALLRSGSRDAKIDMKTAEQGYADTARDAKDVKDAKGIGKAA